MRVCIGDGESSTRGQLPLEGQRRLHVVGRAQSRTYGFGGLVSQSCQRRGGGNRGEEIRIGDYKLLLNNSVVAFSGDDIGQGEAIVENAEAGAQHGFSSRAAAASGSPGNRHAR